VSETLSQVGVVAIGRNEGERLKQCLRSVAGKVAVVVYVDSGSTDGSVAFAQSLGFEGVELDMNQPFTAARARNEGFARMKQICPTIAYVQMVDGDCEVVAGWLETAVAALKQDGKLAVVCGRRRERFPGASIYNRLCDMEWDTPAGLAKHCGGDAMFRVEALEQANGYDPTLIAGEEPELCVRLRGLGWQVRRLEAEMTLHDAAMTRFAQWWKRSVRAGHAAAEGTAMHGNPPERHMVKQVRSMVLWGMMVPALIAAAAILPIVMTMLNVRLGVLSAVLLRVLTLACFAGALLMMTGYLLLAYRVYRHRLERGDDKRDAWLYARFTVIGKFANAAGVWTYRKNRLGGKRTRLMEYKSASV
jgi:GT2 family glycosyltransferase